MHKSLKWPKRQNIKMIKRVPSWDHKRCLITARCRTAMQPNRYLWRPLNLPSLMLANSIWNLAQQSKSRETIGKWVCNGNRNQKPRFRDKTCGKHNFHRPKMASTDRANLPGRPSVSLFLALSLSLCIFLCLCLITWFKGFWLGHGLSTWISVAVFVPTRTTLHGGLGQCPG